MKPLLGLAQSIDRLSGFIGRSVSWLIVAAALISAGNAMVRKAFDISSNSWLELQWWLFALVFFLAAPWTLAQNEHIRIDVVNNLFPRWMRNAVEIVGHVFFLLPTAALIMVTSWHYFVTAYGQNEQSSNAGGLPQWPIKALIPLAFALLLLQGIAELIKRVAIIQGVMTEKTGPGAYHELAVAAGSELKTPPADLPTTTRTRRGSVEKP
ncbi:MAG: TRAP transporter small permease subunit [Hyphomicrobium sp.]|jgi:TRAP-type mannitol/chloroaromatic compound transport system permease small subunit